METIPATFWMIIVSVITIMLCSALYYLAMLLKECRDTVQKMRPTIEVLQKTISGVSSTVDEINGVAQSSFRTVNGIASVVSGFMSGVRNRVE